MSVPPGTQSLTNKARPAKVKEEGDTPAADANDAVTIPRPIPTIPPPPGRRTLPSELIPDENTKNAPRFVFLCSLFLILEARKYDERLVP